MTAVAQVCLVLSVAENGSDWQLTQIGLKRSDLSRTLDRIKTDDLEKSRILVSFLGPRSSGEPVRGSSLSRTLERKIQFWAGRPLLYRNSPSCKLCKHVKTRGFGRDFPYRRVTLQNFDGESQIFELLQFGTILLKI